MAKTTVTTLLAAYFCLTWAAMLTRVEHFPLTWTPMYSLFFPSDSIPSEINDKQRQADGLLVTHRDGTTSAITRKDINIPERHFRRLYFKRMFASGPGKFPVLNRSLGTFNRWLWDITEEDLLTTDDWGWRILRSLNKTLGYAPSDAKFIIRVEAEREHVRYRKADLKKIEQRVEHAVWEWQADWQERWHADTR